jgi:hypothetical protein
MLWLLIHIKRNRHCEEIPVKNNYVISEAILIAQGRVICAMGIASALSRIFFIFEKLRNDATVFVDRNIAPQTSSSMSIRSC